MKTSFYYFVVDIFMAITIVFGCKKSQEEEDAIVQVEQAREHLKEVREEQQSEKWLEFKSEVDQKVAANEMRIAELKEKMQQSGEKMDAVYAKRVDELERKNNEMKAKIAVFQERSESDWESFKREFNHDTEELGNALADLGKDNAR